MHTNVQKMQQVFLYLFMTSMFLFVVGCDVSQSISLTESEQSQLDSISTLLSGSARVLDLGPISILRLEGIKLDCENATVLVDGTYLARLSSQGNSNYKVDANVSSVSLECNGQIVASTRLS